MVRSSLSAKLQENRFQGKFVDITPMKRTWILLSSSGLCSGDAVSIHAGDTRFESWLRCYPDWGLHMLSHSFKANGGIIVLYSNKTWPRPSFQTCSSSHLIWRFKSMTHAVGRSASDWTNQVIIGALRFSSWQ
jgi:hypothetical protein